MSTNLSIIFVLLVVIAGITTALGDCGNVVIHNHYYFTSNKSTVQTTTNTQIDQGPVGLRRFIGKKIRIRSAYFNEYLYTDTREVVQQDRWSVFFDRTKNHKGNQYHWTIVPVDAYKEGFALKNVWNTWLYTPVNSFLFDSERRRVFMWIPLDDYDYTGEWVFEPVPNSNSNFYIKSKHRGEYLYPFDDGNQPVSSGRQIFTWIPELTEFGLQMEWVLELVE